jgi:hypothetical protein
MYHPGNSKLIKDISKTLPVIFLWKENIFWDTTGNWKKKLESVLTGFAYCLSG